MEFYIVKDDEIKLSNKITNNNIVFILDGKAGYIWRGKNAIDLDEITTKNMEKLIKSTFEDISFVLIQHLESVEKDNPKLVQIKTEIKNRLPITTFNKRREGKSGRFKKIRERLTEFRNYETSFQWRMKLSNLTNLWKLSIFNIIIIGIVITLIINTSIFHAIIGDYSLIIALICLLIIFSVNLIFFTFPMKFPVRVLSIGKESDERIIIPPKPISPESPVLSTKSKQKKQVVTQIKLEPLKAPVKGDNKLNDIGETKGVEYMTEEDMELEIPVIPEAPKKKEKITVESSKISTDLIEKIKNMESADIEVVLVNCSRCKDVIPLPVPKKAVLKSELSLVPISYVHKNKKNKDQHCITIHIDHDFDIRRERISDVVLS